MAICVLDRPGKERDQIVQWVAEECGGEAPQLCAEIDQLQRQVSAVPPRICFIRLGREDIPGLRAAASIRQQSPETRIVFIADSADYAITAYELGAYGYLLSPVKQDKLSKLLMHAAVSY